MIKTLIFLISYLLIMPQTEETNLKFKFADFTDQKVRSQWDVTNDDVMGGVSKSRISVGEKNELIFSGEVSLENNGGFASLRSPIDDYDFSDYEGVMLKVKSDGKTYSLSFRQTKFFSGYNYNQKFNTGKDNWQLVMLPFKDFKLKYYGREVSNSEQPDKSAIKQVSILISDKQQGPFKIEIEWIGLY
ncbi:MAG: CIA30 family protein [Ignavibacteriaceae bacterium]|jgi:monofunctional biosynthetic peptidoglycan transglycosylase|nr:CIA30 family protein [Ignavibacteriaceae bacterium]